jgi:dihydroorotate dehydrogenase
MDVYRSIVRPVLFRTDAERAHELGKRMLRRSLPWSLVGPGDAVADPRLSVDLAGLRLSNPVGLAAGFDKDCEMLRAFQALGFGYAIPGSVRGSPAGDNPSPRIVRYPTRESMINCQGFPSKGAARAARQLEGFSRHRRSMKVITNITGFTIDEYLEALGYVQPWADGVEISLSCPNERYESLDFLEPDLFRHLIDRLNERKKRPFFVKIRNYNDERERDNRFRLIESCLDLGIDGVTLPGAHIASEPRLSLGRGNLSGRAVFGRTLQNVGDVYDATRGRIAIKALGGVFTAQDAFDAIAAGASSVELLTGLVYEGWSVAQRINAGLLELMAARSIPNVEALRGRSRPPHIHSPDAVGAVPGYAG